MVYSQNLKKNTQLSLVNLQQFLVGGHSCKDASGAGMGWPPPSNLFLPGLKMCHLIEASPLATVSALTGEARAAAGCGWSLGGFVGNAKRYMVTGIKTDFYVLTKVLGTECAKNPEGARDLRLPR